MTIPPQVSQTAPRQQFVRHPLVNELPTLPKESPDYRRIVESIRADGIIEPLKCVRDDERLLVIDGLHRLQIAEELALPELPYRTVETDELVGVICGSAIRAGWSKSALAYRMWPLFEAITPKRLGRPKKGNDFPFFTSSQIAEKLGVSEKLVDQAKRAHAYFAKNPEERLELEPSVLTGILPLHQIGANGSKGNRHRTDKPPVLDVIDRLKPLPKSFEQWDRMDESSQRRARRAFIESIFELPEAIQEAVFEALEVKFRP